MSKRSTHLVSCCDLKRMITILVLLIVEAGTQAADWSVDFENPDPCAVRGSSVEFRCSYSYEDRQTVKETSWYKGRLRQGDWKRVKLSDLPLYENRSEYVGDKQHDCSLALHDLQLDDTGHYYFGFDTEKYGYRSRKSVYLSVTELRARVHPDTVRAGDHVTLDCRTSCSLNSTVWYKDGRKVTKSTFRAQAEDAGKYLCVVEGQESVGSDPVALDVQHPPMNVSVEVSYPSILTEDSSVNLTCSSSANPAAVSYTWFRRTASPNSRDSSLIQVGSGQVLSVPAVEVSHSELYHCQARNIVGENNSTEVLLTKHESLTQTSLHHILLLVGSGAKAVILLILSLIMIWAWCWRKRSISAEEKQDNNSDYENISAAVRRPHRHGLTVIPSKQQAQDNNSDYENISADDGIMNTG